MRLKALFALSALIGVLGLFFLSASSVLAGPSTFTTLRGEPDSWTSEEGFCNEAFDGGQCEACAGTAMSLGYKASEMNCTVEAYEDCGSIPPCCLNDGNNGDTNCPDWING